MRTVYHEGLTVNSSLRSSLWQLQALAMFTLWHAVEHTPDLSACVQALALQTYLQRSRQPFWACT